MTHNKNVLILVENSYLPLDIRVRYEAETLRDAGWNVTVICPSPPRDFSSITSSINSPIEINGIKVQYFPLETKDDGFLSYLSEYVSGFFSLGKLSWREWKNHRFDILHVCNPPDIFFPISFFYKLLGARIVFDHHDLFPEQITWRYRNKLGKLLYIIARLMEYLTFRSANVVISTNNSYKEIAKKRGNLKENNIFVVRNGPKLTEFLPVEPVPSLKLGSPYMVCYAGVMGFEDGILELVDSIRYLVVDLKRHDTLFTLLGDGPVRKEALSKVSEYGLENFIVMPGMVHDKLLLRQYFSTADILLAPEPVTPLNTYSTFIKVAEYMAVGKPIVAYDLPETKFTAMGAALYAEPGAIENYSKAIITLLDSPSKRREMGMIGRKRIDENLSWEHQQHELLKAYEKALK